MDIPQLQQQLSQQAEALVTTIRQLRALDATQNHWQEPSVIYQVRKICHELLEEAGANGCGGCDLCRA